MRDQSTTRCRSRYAPRARPIALLGGLLIVTASASCARARIERLAPIAAEETRAPLQRAPVALDDTSPRSSPDTASADSTKYPSRLFILEIFKTGHVAPPKFLDQWFDAKKKFAKRTGLSVAASYTVLRQDYSSSPIKQPISIGSKFAFLADYQLANRGKPNALSFDVVVEERQPLGTDLAPTPAGLGAGSIVPTATTWGRFDLGFTQYYLRQNLAGNRFQYVIGKLFAQYYIDAYPFFDDNRQFISRAFSTDATIPAPTRGFGLVGAWYPIVNHGFYVQSGMYTANSHDTGLTIDDFFKTGQHFYNLNLGWTRIEDKGVPPLARGVFDTDDIYVFGWYKNKQPAIPEARGVAFNANAKVRKNFLVFLRAAWSDGWVVDGTTAAGFGWRPARFPADLLGVGAGWARPSDRTRRNQYMEEVFYRFHLLENLSLTPDVQLIRFPALSPRQELLWAPGLRARVTF
jgi:hypothetical protein